jgi:hypothetical protein
MADQDDMPAALVVNQGLAVNLGDERTSRVDGEKPAGERRLGHGLRNPMRRKDHRGVAIRDLVELADEHRPLLPEVFHHVFVVNDLMADIDRRPMDRQRLLDRVDGTDHTRAETARRAEQDIEGWLRHDAAMWRDEAPPVKRERRLFAARPVPRNARAS